MAADKIDSLANEIVRLNKKFDDLADKGLSVWAKKSYSAWIMVGVVVVLPLVGVVVGFNLK